MSSEFDSQQDVALSGAFSAPLLRSREMRRQARNRYQYQTLVVVLLILGSAISTLTSCTSHKPDDQVARKVGISPGEVQRTRKTFGLSTHSLLRMDEHKVRSLLLEGQHQDMALYREDFWAMLHR